MNIQNISTIPPHLDEFIKKNHKDLNDIYEKSKEEQGDGLLSLKSDEANNDVKVFYMDENAILENFPKETWENLKSQRGDKKIFIIESNNNMFILYI